MPKIKSLLITVITNKKLPFYLAGIGLALYIAQTALFTQIRVPNMDEGAYLFKGLQYARGASVPFEPYGFWTNKMYLTFYLYGWIQMLFEPGLLTSRIFAATLGVFSVIGIWLMARRFSNNWIAAAAVWAMALNPSMISIYSIGNSQAVVIFFLVWSLAFSLGGDRKSWQLITGAGLAAIMVLCRENMIFVLPFLAVYIFWQHGKKQGFLALLTMSVILIVGHLVFWPEIMFLWTRWIPFNSNNGGTFPTDSVRGDGRFSIFARIQSLSLAIRVFFVPMVVILITLILWPNKDSWKSSANFKIAVFLISALLVLIISHIWASIGKNYCVYCTTNYFAFFMPLGLVLFAVCFSSSSRKPGVFALFSSLLAVPLIAALIGFSYYEQYGYILMKLAVPRVSNGIILPGTVQLWQLLFNKFHIEYESARMLIPTLMGVLIGIAILLLIWIIFRSTQIKKFVSFSYFSWISLLILSLIFFPLLSWPTQETFSKVSMTSTFKKVGETLAQSTTPGDKVYIDGLITAIPLLYVEGLEYLPAQINVKFSFVEGLDSDALSRNGLWNGEIARDWRNQSEVFIIGQEEYASWAEYIESAELSKVPIDIDYSRLPDSSKIYIFRRP